MDKEGKIKRLKEVLPLFWNSYQHMYDVRERKVGERINFLLIISTFLPLLSVGLYATELFNSTIILIPIIPQFLSIVVLLKYFVVSEPLVHWLEMNEKLFESLEGCGVESNTLITLKGLEKYTHIAFQEGDKIIRRSRSFVLFSLLALLLSASFVLLQGSLYLYLFVLILVIISYYILFIYYRQPDFSGINKVVGKSNRLLGEWLKD